MQAIARPGLMLASRSTHLQEWDHITGEAATFAWSSVLGIMEVERGESLNEWCSRVSPNFATTLFVLLHVAERLQQLHASGLCHRDLKPANILWLPISRCWTLIDFGCAAQIGAVLPSWCNCRKIAAVAKLACVQREAGYMSIWRAGVKFRHGISKLSLSGIEL
jgi:serine/threonine protein kinase